MWGYVIRSQPACHRLQDPIINQEPSASPLAEPGPEELPADDEPADDDAVDAGPAVVAPSRTAAVWLAGLVVAASAVAVVTDLLNADFNTDRVGFVKFGRSDPTGPPSVRPPDLFAVGVDVLDPTVSDSLDVADEWVSFVVDAPDGFVVDPPDRYVVDPAKGFVSDWADGLVVEDRTGSVLVCCGAVVAVEASALAGA